VAGAAHAPGYPPDAERYLKEPWPLDQGIVGRVAANGIPTRVPDVSQDPDYVPLRSAVRSQLTVPVAAKTASLASSCSKATSLTALTGRC